MTGFSYIDIFLGIPLIWALYKGFRKGLIIEIASLVALILGIYCSINFSSFVSDYLKSSFDIKTAYLPFISFASTFIIVVIIIYVIAFIIEKFVNLISLSFINKIAGSFFSLVKIGFILSVMLFIIESIDIKNNIISSDSKKKSILYKPISYLAIKLIPSIKSIKFSKPFALNQDS